MHVSLCPQSLVETAPWVTRALALHLRTSSGPPVSPGSPAAPFISEMHTLTSFSAFHGFKIVRDVDSAQKPSRCTVCVGVLYLKFIKI